MNTIILSMIATLVAALLSMFPDQAPPMAWWAVLVIYACVPLVGWLEYQIAKSYEASRDENHLAILSLQHPNVSAGEQA